MQIVRQDGLGEGLRFSIPKELLKDVLLRFSKKLF